ncbi:hypothetical protein ACFXTI_042984 [Malus domestica]
MPVPLGASDSSPDLENRAMLRYQYLNILSRFKHATYRPRHWGHHGRAIPGREFLVGNHWMRQVVAQI